MEEQIDEVGMLTFLRFFEKHPRAKTKFNGFSDVPITDLRGSDMFRNHTSRIMSTLKRVRKFFDQLNNINST